MRLRAPAVTTRLPPAAVRASEPFLPTKFSSTEIADSNFSTWYCACSRSSRSCCSALVRLAIVFSSLKLMQLAIVKVLTMWAYATALCKHQRADLGVARPEDRSEFRATQRLGRQVQEVRVHDQSPRHRSADRALGAGQSRAPAPRHCHRNLLMLLGCLQVQPG